MSDEREAIVLDWAEAAHGLWHTAAHEGFVYIARSKSPSFCFEAESLEEAERKAGDAFNFYLSRARIPDHLAPKE